MKALKQAAHDLFKEWAWLLLFGAFSAVVLYRFVLAVGSIPSLVEAARTVSAYKREGIYLVINSVSDELYSIPDGMKAEAAGPGAVTPLNELMKKGFAEDGCLGGRLFLPFRDQTLFDNIMIITGKMIDLADLDVPEDADIYIAVSPDRADAVGKRFAYDGNELFVSAALPEGLSIGAISGNVSSDELNNTVVFFARDYDAVYRLFWYSGEHYLSCLIAVDPEPEFMTELLKSVMAATGAVPTVRTAQEQLEITGDMGAKQLFLRLAFFAAASLAVIAALVMNLTRVIDARMRAYAVDRLFGASNAHIFLRMLLFALGFELIPIAYTALRILFPTGLSFEDGTERLVILPFMPGQVSRMLVFFAALAALAAGVVTASFLRFKRHGLQGMRKD